MSLQKFDAQKGNSTAITLVVVVFAALVVVGTWAAYTHGGDHFMINGRTVDQLEPWEVIGGVIIGILGAVFGLLMGVVGLLIGLVVAVASIALGLLGGAIGLTAGLAGLFITAGVLLGPFLLLAAIILLLRRPKSQADEI